MATAAAVRDSSVGRRIRPLKELVQHVNGIIQIIVVRLANGDMEFAANPRAKHLPILLQDKMKIVSFPMFNGRSVDDARLGMPQSDRTTVRSSGTICRIPCAPLLTGKRPAIGITEDVFHLTFAADRKLD